MRFSNGLSTSFASVFLVLLASACGDSGNAPSGGEVVVQQIGDFDGPAAQEVRSKLTVVPFSPDNDPTAHPLMISPGFGAAPESSNTRGSQAGYALTELEKDAIQLSYAAGQTLSLLSPSADDVAALHQLLEDGVAYTSTSDPIPLAYNIRDENRIPTSRVLVDIRPTPDSADDPGADDRAYARAYDLLLSDLSRKPLSIDEVTENVPSEPYPLDESPVARIQLSSTTGGQYNTLVHIYAGHVCEGPLGASPFDFYVATAQGDWTPTEAHWESASALKNQITLEDDDETLSIDWQQSDEYCEAGIVVDKGIGGGGDSRACRYVNYPLDYRVELVPPVETTSSQIFASPSADQGRSTTYSSSFSINIGTSVNISGKGASAGLQGGCTWSNSVSSTVPPMVVEAGNIGAEQGAYTEFMYCTKGKSAGACESAIGTSGTVGICNNLKVGPPENGQKTTGRLSEVETSARWDVQFDPDGYAPNQSSYNITVNWEVDLATSTSWLWGGAFDQFAGGQLGPDGSCNQFGCSCNIRSTTTNTVETSHTFAIPLPSRAGCPRA